MLDTIRLSDTQKRVIAKIIAAPTPKVAAEEISDGDNMIKARDILMDLGLITMSLDDHAELTDNGRQVARDENLVDETDNLTPDGEKYAYTDTTGGDDKDNQPGEQPQDAAGGDMPPMPQDDMLTMSASTTGSLLSELLHSMNFNVR